MLKAYLESYGNFILRAFDFHSRARPIEYWAVFPVIWGLILYALTIDITNVWYTLLAGQRISLNPLAYLSGLIFLLTLIPRMALNVRRLHDRDRSALWLFFPAAFSLSLPVAIIALAGCMMNSSLTGVPNGPDELSNVFFPVKLYLFSPAMFWQEMFAIARAFEALGSETIGGLISEIYGYSGAVDVRRDATNVKNESEGDFSHTLSVFFAVAGLICTPPLTALMHTFFAALPSSEQNNKYGPGKLGKLQYKTKPDTEHNPFAGYALLYEKTDEEKAMQQQRKELEMKNLYRQRVLGQQ